MERGGKVSRQGAAERPGAGRHGELAAGESAGDGGRALFTEQEARGAARVILINTVAAERLFGDDAIGKEVILNSIQRASRGGPFSVIGVFRDEAGFLSGGDRRAW